MEVRFATKRLANTLTNDRPRVRTYGEPVAKRLHVRLAEFAMAPSLAEMRDVPGGCHELHGDREGQLAVTVTRNLRLVFRPSEDPPPERDGGGLAWTRVNSITVVEVTDYHGK